MFVRVVTATIKEKAREAVLDPLLQHCQAFSRGVCFGRLMKSGARQ
jgi:hypothetical protein